MDRKKPIDGLLSPIERPSRARWVRYGRMTRADDPRLQQARQIQHCASKVVGSPASALGCLSLNSGPPRETSARWQRRHSTVAADRRQGIRGHGSQPSTPFCLAVPAGRRCPVIPTVWAAKPGRRPATHAAESEEVITIEQSIRYLVLPADKWQDTQVTGQAPRMDRPACFSSMQQPSSVFPLFA